MQLDCLRDKQIAIIGLGVTGLSCIRYLQTKQSLLSLQLCAMDSRKAVELPDFNRQDISISMGGFDERMLTESQIWVVSPGIALNTPELVAAKQPDTIILGDIELFALFYNANQVAHPHRRLAAVTGSNGKSTVVTLMRDMAQAAGLKVSLAGNIGTPALEVVDTPSDLVILELSSFQLETTQSLIPDVASILNLSEDHMDRYPDLAGYCEAKQRIYSQAKSAVCFLDDAHTHPPATIDRVSCFSAKPQSEGFGMNVLSVGNDSGASAEMAITLHGKPYLRATELSVLGKHNLLNIQAAAGMMHALGVSDSAILDAARSFSGLPHRCQQISRRLGIIWINDSKATNVGATLAAISGLRSAISGKLHLLAGGESKHADLTSLQSSLDNDVSSVILFGKDAPLIKALCSHAVIVSDIAEAVKTASQKAIAGDVVLLSPACASLDMFDNYQHRGNAFIEAVEALH